MRPEDSVPWPPGYRSVLLWVSWAGWGVVALAVLCWSLASVPYAAFGLFVALAALWIRGHMQRSPMLAIQDGKLLCRLRGRSVDQGAKLTKEVFFRLEDIDAIERQIHPWPGKGGERHYYTVLLRDGGRRGLVPRPADPPVRAALAEFFERHFPGRIREIRP